MGCGALKPCRVSKRPREPAGTKGFKVEGFGPLKGSGLPTGVREPSTGSLYCIGIRVVQRLLEEVDPSGSLRLRAFQLRNFS